MDIVIDASVIIAVVMNESTKSNLISLTKGASLFAPSSVHWEVGNALSAMFKRKRIGLPEALKAIEAYDQILLRYTDVDLVQAIELANQFGIYAYDSYILACAQNQKCSLITLDGALSLVATKAGITVLEVN